MLRAQLTLHESQELGRRPVSDRNVLEDVPDSFFLGAACTFKDYVLNVIVRFFSQGVQQERP